MREGCAHASTLTDYPLGVVKVLPFQAHLALDAIGAIALAATPFVTGQCRKGPAQWVPHVALCAFELAPQGLRGSSRGEGGRVAAQRSVNAS